MLAYKLFKIKKSCPGEIFPLYVCSEKSIPFNEWVPAEPGQMTKNGKVKSKLGELCYRPGWHLSDIPLATHIGIKEDGIIKYMHADEVWCECEFSDSVNYQPEANRNGTHNNKLNPQKAMLKYIPVNGFYRYKTSPQMLGEWIIAGEVKVNRVLSDEEVSDIVRKHGYMPQPRKNPLNYDDYGFKVGDTL